jgi:NAD(P)-dependent dehydrogenase (short-subunit alcohol dehydrogenase family)
VTPLKPEQPMSFEGKNCLITGAAGNLGRALAAAFAAAGAGLTLLDHDDGKLRAAYGHSDRQRVLVRTDLLDSGSIAKAVKTSLDRFGRIDVLCNIAGGFRMGQPVHQTSDETWSAMLDLNAKSVIYTARAVVPGMLATAHGKIVNIAASAGLTGKENMGAYSASKSAVIRLTESMAAELRDKGINVNCILPSIIDTPQNRAAMPKADPHRWVTPQALADVVLFLASERASAIHGAAIPVTGLV